MKSGGKDYKKFFTVLLIGLFLVTLVSPMVFAQESPQLAPDDGVFVTLWKAFFGGIFDGDGGIFDRLQKEGRADDIQRILLIILVALLVYSISDFLPFAQDKEYVKWAVSVVVALLAFLFIKKETLGGIVNTYGALGVALTSVIPLLILLAFSAKIKDKPKLAGFSRLLDIFMFSIFALWMVLQWQTQKQLGEPFVRAYLFSAVVALFLVFFWPWIWKKFNERKTKERSDISNRKSLKTQQAHIERAIQSWQAKMENADTDEIGEIEDRLNELQNARNEIIDRLDH